jgi:hypothetical protein
MTLKKFRNNKRVEYHTPYLDTWTCQVTATSAE